MAYLLRYKSMSHLKKNIKYFLLILFCLSTSRLAAQGQWTVSGSLTRGLTGAAAVVVDSTIYVLGGYSDSTQNVVNWIQKFDPESGQFTYVTQMKSRRTHFFAVVSDSNIYYTGGEFGSGHHTAGTLECFNLRTGLVTAIDTSRKYNRFFISGIVADSILYLVGGTPTGGDPSPGLNPYIMEFNLNKKEITYNYSGMFSNNLLRSGHITIIYNSYLYIFGGNYNTVLAEVFRYSLNDKTLQRIFPNMTVPRTNAAAVITNNGNAELLIMGGFNEGNSALNSVEKFIFRSSSITSQFFPPMNIKRKNFNSVLLGDNVYVFGGKNEFGQSVRDIEKFQLLTTAEDLMDEIPKSFLLEQNYPNPFNPSTVISFQIKNESRVTLTIYDVLGNIVKVLQDEILQSGLYNRQWDAVGISSGIYFYELITQPTNQSENLEKPFRQVKKMMLLK